MDGWNTSFLLGWTIFRGLLVSGSVVVIRKPPRKIVHIYLGFERKPIIFNHQMWLEKFAEILKPSTDMALSKPIGSL